METVKVDIQKLQLLNDRIAQTIDALNQVRMSAHGIQHTPPLSPWGVNPYAAYGGTPYPVQPTFATPFAPYSVPFAPTPYTTPVASGIQHTSPSFLPYSVPFVPTPGIQHSTAGYAPQTTTPYTNNGISHTSWDPLWRTPQTWPVTQQYQWW